MDNKYDDEESEEGRLTLPPISSFTTLDSQSAYYNPDAIMLSRFTASSAPHPHPHQVTASSTSPYNTHSDSLIPDSDAIRRLRNAQASSESRLRRREREKQVQREIVECNARIAVLDQDRLRIQHQDNRLQDAIRVSDQDMIVLHSSLQSIRQQVQEFANYTDGTSHSVDTHVPPEVAFLEQRWVNEEEALNYSAQINDLRFRIQELEDILNNTNE